MKSLFNSANARTNNVQNAAYILIILTAISYIFALIRNKLLAFELGAEQSLDLYFAAFRIPDIIFIISIIFISSYALIPFFEKKSIEHGYKLKNFVDSIFTVYLLIIALLAIVGFIFMPLFTEIFFSGFDPTEVSTLTGLSRILLLQVVFLSFSTFLSSIIQFERRFIIYGLLPIFYNLGILLGIIFFLPHFGLKGLVFGVVLGSIFHLIIQIPSIIKSNLFPKIKIRIDETKEIFNVVKHSIPRTLSYSFNSLTLVALVGFTAYLAEGSVAIFNLSEDIRSIPVALIGAAYSIAIFPTIANLFANNKMIEMKNEIKSVVNRLVFLIFPITAFMIILREPIVTLLLGGGNFDQTDILITQGIVGVLMVSAFAWVFMLVFSRIFYATSNKSPFLIFGTVMLLTVIFGYLLTFDKIESDFIYSLSALFGIPEAGNPLFEIAFVRMATDLIGLGLFVLMLGIVYKFNIFKGAFKLFRNQIIATFISAGTLYYVFNFIKGVSDNPYIDSFVSIMVSSTIGIIVWVIILAIFKDIELKKFLSKLTFIGSN